MFINIKERGERGEERRDGRKASRKFLYDPVFGWVSNELANNFFGVERYKNKLATINETLLIAEDGNGYREVDTWWRVKLETLYQL